jgi:protein-tyrosine phosphatase
MSTDIDDEEYVWKTYYNSCEEAQEIISGLYLGKYTSVLNTNWIKETGITHNIDLSQMIPTYVCSGLDRKIIDITDEKSSNISFYFEECNKYIDDALATNGKILVNCYAGISRSATIVAAYLIKKEKISFDVALDIIVNKRECVYPNEGFRKQLEEYGKQNKII